MKRCRLEGSPIVYHVEHAEQSEQAEWAVFLHAAFVDHGMFQAQVEHFKGRYNIIAIDIIGHGESTQASKGDSIDKMATWIKAILDAEGADNAHVVGVSLGAVLAQDFANRYPEAVRSLACFGAYDINDFDPSMQKQNGSAQMLMMVKALFSIKWFASSNKRISAYTPDAQEAFYAMNMRFPRSSFRFLASLGRLVNARPSTPRRYPLLIGCGEHDIPMELTVTELWKEKEPGCSCVIFADAGHCVNMDAPHRFNAILESFWADGSVADPD